MAKKKIALALAALALSFTAISLCNAEGLVVTGEAQEGAIGSGRPLRYGGTASGATVVSRVPTEKLTVAVGKSVTIQTRSPVERVSIANPDVVDALIPSPTQICIAGKLPGSTSLTLGGMAGNVVAIFDVEVTADVAGLKMRLHEMLPNEKGIKVIATRESITLSGTVSGPDSMTQALTLAQSYAPRDKEGMPKRDAVVNLLEVSGVQQVMLEVRVSEMARTLSKQLGFNFNVVSASGRQFGISLLNGLTSFPSAGWPGNPLTVSSTVNGAFSFLQNGATWTTLIDALKDDGLLRVLAEPTLITMSGRPANFLAGGEFPIPVPQSGVGVAVITIQYKPYGVALSFTPTVLGDGRINMIVAPEVSELDFSQAVSLQGYIIPSIITRRASTTVELADGQSFAIAGLIQEEMKEDIQKYPILGDIPILGALFRSSSFAKSETELVIIVTAHLVKPLDLSKQTLPTDSYVEPDDFEFYLEGRLEGRDAGPQGSALPRAVGKGGMEGDFGYILPGKEEK